MCCPCHHEQHYQTGALLELKNTQYNCTGEPWSIVIGLNMQTLALKIAFKQHEIR